MPLRRDPALWFNLPGVVAAYQPVAAPGPLLARYNQAHGGSNRYKAVDGTVPTWAAHTGWTFVGASSQYLETGVVVGNNRNWSMFVRFSGITPTINSVFCGAIMIAGGNPRFTLGLEGAGFPRLYGNGGYLGTGTQEAAAVMGMAGTTAYWNGVAESGSISTEAGDISIGIDIGRRRRSDGGHDQYYNGEMQALVISETKFSPAEAWQASRQMAYCHVNPEWSAWGRRRRYYYAPAAAGGAAKMNTYFRRMRS